MVNLRGPELVRRQGDSIVGKLLRHLGDERRHVLLHPHALRHAHLHLSPHHGNALETEQSHGRSHASSLLPLPRVRHPHRVQLHQLQYYIIITSASHNRHLRKNKLHRFVIIYSISNGGYIVNLMVD